ncbi:small integral membrane protein 20 [Discoglossus pictus]
MARNTRIVLIFGGFITAVAAAFYPIFFHPMMHIDEYKKEQSVNRSDVIQADVQPPGLKVWTDPFSRK